MSIQSAQQLFGRLSTSGLALAALGAALDAQVSGVPLPGPLATRVQALLEAVGAGEVLDGIPTEQAAGLLVMIRALTSLDARLLQAETRTMRWDVHDPTVLQAIGKAAAAHAQVLSHVAVPTLPGLAARLSAPGAAFLDVGVGVGGLALAMARSWPAARIVGIDIWGPALSLANENVQAAGQADRIELREQGIEDLPDEAAFDLAWVPVAFMPASVFGAAAERSRRALRPGGWVVFNMTPDMSADPLMAAVWQLRGVAWAGHASGPAHFEGLLREAGFADVHAIPLPPGSVLGLVAGRRA